MGHSTSFVSVGREGYSPSRCIDSDSESVSPDDDSSSLSDGQVGGNKPSDEATTSSKLPPSSVRGSLKVTPSNPPILSRLF